MNPNPYIDDDLQALAETARRFAQERVAPGFQERDQTRVLDRALVLRPHHAAALTLSPQSSGPPCRA